MGVALSMTSARGVYGSVTLALELPEIVRRADRVVLGEVVAVTSRWDARHRVVVSVIDVTVAESWKGTVSASRRLKVVQVGGEAEGYVTKVFGQATFAAGERAVLFLRGPEDQAVVVGLGQGKRPLRPDPARGRWMVDPGDRSAAVRVGPDGRHFPAAEEPAVPLDELRQRVVELAGGR
jgi:hypothetical protein